MEENKRSKDLGWVLSANFAEGLPYAVITTLSVVMMADMGLSNTEVAAWTSLLAMPWSFKALWSPWIGNTRRWMWLMQVALAVCIAGVALSLLSSNWLTWCLIALTVGAFSSATYDISCDGFYMKALDKDAQSFFVGIRSTAYRLSMIFASGVLTTLVGLLARSNGGDLTRAWFLVMLGVAGLMLVFAFVHRMWLPRLNVVAADGARRDETDWVGAFKAFILKRDLWFILLFLLFYRLGEALLSKMTILFLKAPVETGGLGLDNAEYGLIYGTVGVGMLTIGGILGGMLVSKYGLRKCVIPLALMLNVPDLLYVWMSIVQPQSRLLIGSLVGVEQFGYGLGFTAYMVFMLQSSQGKFSTSHYAILTALMALGMNGPSMMSGLMQESLGYTQFFWAAVACTVPGMILSVILARKKTPVSEADVAQS
ncbi:MAG: MFS transporter [Bacteroidales bacterium]|nr:MFS transporter [Bacteroidales bacterium]